MDDVMETILPPQKKRKYDEIKHVLRRLESLLEVIVLGLLYFGVWRVSYDLIPSMPRFNGNGKYILIGVYVILVVVLFYMSDGFKFGYFKFAEIFTSQCIAILIVNFVSYFQLCLIANRMISCVPILLLSLIDVAVVALLVYLYTAIYHVLYVPRNMVMIYGRENALDLKFKMDTRSDKYRVTRIMNIEEGFNNICSEILKHDAVIINDVPAEIRNDILKYCYEREIRTYMVPKISDIIGRGAEEIKLFDTPLLLVKGVGLSISERVAKRSFDIVLCMIALTISLPIMLIVAIAIKLEDGGPVFYKQKRITQGGKEFDILKFRSMIVDAEKNGYSLQLRASNHDPRITKVGNWIRACRIDELPQIINILKGDMSIVGPRPERVENVEAYTNEIPEFVYRTKVKGGLTGYAQIYGKYNTDPYDKIRMDLMYIENYSLLLDIKLIIMTLQILFRSESTEGFDKRVTINQKCNELIRQEGKRSKTDE